MYKTRKRDIEELRERIVNAWEDFDKLVIDVAVGYWRNRFGACVEAEGGHFEHKLQSDIIFRYKNKIRLTFIIDQINDIFKIMKF